MGYVGSTPVMRDHSHSDAEGPAHAPSLCVNRPLLSGNSAALRSWVVPAETRGAASSSPSRPGPASRGFGTPHGVMAGGLA